MDITSMKTLLELQAMQNLGTSNDSNSSTPSSSSTLFSELIGDLMNEQTTGTLGATNNLGAVNSLQQIVDTMQTNVPAQQAGTANSYIASFLLNSSNNALPLTTVAPSSPVEQMTLKLEQYTKDYTGRQSFESFLAGAEKYRAEIAKAAQTYNIPEKLIASVMKQESNFNPTAVSSAGASGLMQLMPSTARYLGINDRFDPEQNIMGGAKYLRQMLDQFGNDMSTALAAYNAGPGNVKKYDGIPPFKETQNYVKNVLNYFNT